MKNEQTPQQLDQAVKVMRLIIVALTMGVVMFGVITLFLQVADRGGRPILIAWIAAGFAVVNLLMRQVMGTVLSASARKQIAAGTWQPPQKNSVRVPENATHADRLLMSFQTRLIVRAALLEGAAFFNLIAFMIERQTWSFGIAGALAAINLSTFPSRDSVLYWIRQQLELMELERNQRS